MRVLELLRQLISTVIVLGLILGSAASRPAMAGASAPGGVASAMPMARMDCHKGEHRTIPDCTQACPWASLCAPNALEFHGPVFVGRVAVAHRYAQFGEDLLARPSEPPPPRPPRS